MTTGLQTTVRFFVADYETDEVTEKEVTELEWLETKGMDITYERHTMRDNGCDQVCLTKVYKYSR